MNTLLVIDPQNDFLDRGNATLKVPGATKDMQRLTRWFRDARETLDDVIVTLDTHEFMDIGHPAFWRDANGGLVGPFTIITADDVKLGTYLPVEKGETERVISYLERLEGRDRYRHTVWPAHCVIGSRGHAIERNFNVAISQWELSKGRSAARIMKGMNRFCESYSAIEAEVPDAGDPATLTNWPLIDRVLKADFIFVAGQALSHCVKATVTDLIYKSGKNPGDIARKLVLLRDAMSPVAGFEQQGEEFIEMCRGLGASIITIE